MKEKSLSTAILDLTKRDIHQLLTTDSTTRIVFQKVLYLLQSSRPLVSPTYEFEFHFSGPYSSE